jgi:heme-degrading monooxygenase HmoA
MGVNFYKGRQSAPHLGHVLLGLVTYVAEARAQLLLVNPHVRDRNGLKLSKSQARFGLAFGETKAVQATAAGIDEASPQGRERLAGSDPQSDFRSYCGACTAPLRAADLPGKPGCRPPFQKNTLDNLYLVEPNENGTAMIQWLADAPPQAPFYASIFNYFLSENLQGYAEYDAETLALVQGMPGYLGYESMKHEGRGTFISYWADMASIQNWAAHPVHQKAKELGRSTWYRYYHSFVAEVQHARFHAH